MSVPHTCVCVFTLHTFLHMTTRNLSKPRATTVPHVHVGWGEETSSISFRLLHFDVSSFWSVGIPEASFFSSKISKVLYNHHALVLVVSKSLSESRFLQCEFECEPSKQKPEDRILNFFFLHFFSPTQQTTQIHFVYR